MIQVNKFKPDLIDSSENEIQSEFFQIFFKSKNIFFSVYGKSSIWNILGSFTPQKKTIIIPYYLCQSVRDSAIKSGYKIYYADIDVEDLNISLDSVRSLCNKYDVGVVLVPSLYGNPANLIEIQKFCNLNGIIMIDDAAQAYGAILENKNVGSFGDAGLISVSPGKPLSGYLGSIFWSKGKVQLKSSFSYHLVNRLMYLDFKYNRLGIDNRNSYYGSLLNKFSLLIKKIFRSDYHNNLTSYDLKYIYSLAKLDINYKSEFIDKFYDNVFFRVLRPLRGKGTDFKLVLIFFSDNEATKFSNYLKKNSIYFSYGYSPLSKEFKSYSLIQKKLFEIPIDPMRIKREYVYETIQNYR